MQAIIKRLLIEIGEDPEREGLLNTPARVAKSYEFLTRGYQQDPCKIITDALFTERCDEMIVVKDIEVYSLCEHHLLPFYGKCHVAYMPNGKVVGLSKIPRVVDVYARRLQVQERLTNQIADLLLDCLNPEGVAVVIEARHLCMMMRGVEKQNTVVSTSALRGVFRDNLSTRAEFMQLIKPQRNV
ncbi:GTP cyclohydrolase I FolE [candidate division KSB1 bacterium]|nr:GTP cyclohydrolase I FolE [candidate division KSB1 bacterium]TDI87044.1 MAG: GTP cyclohydrolase I FolE [Caldithrix sp.]